MRPMVGASYYETLRMLRNMNFNVPLYDTVLQKTILRETLLANTYVRNSFGRWWGHHLPAGIYGFSGGKKHIKFYFWTKHLTRKNIPVS